MKQNNNKQNQQDSNQSQDKNKKNDLIEQDNKQSQSSIRDENSGKIISCNLEQEMQESYLAYAMSVIVSRALPDVRDGLKPVHRRILYAMHELGLKPSAKFRKCATVVGDVLGKYHPHGDVAVYDSMVRMAQPFSMRYPLVNGQGNFGSMDGDKAAAMRYTEAKMQKITEEMLTDIEKDTVDFIDNYDSTRKEPSVLPARIPQLLLNGTLGIAVGMATNIPPHNLSELIDGLIAMIDNSDITTEDLMKFIKGPDFPTGGIIYGSEAIKAAYGTGKGKIIIRGIAQIKERKNSKYRIIISEIPYQVNKAELILKIAEMIKLKRIQGITDLRDESDRKSGVRIVVELKQNAYPKKVLNKLYQLTNLQIAYHFNTLALVNRIQPKTLTLKDILEEFIKHRKVIVTRRTKFELKKATLRAHILEGLKKALDCIDKIIETIRGSETKEIAHKNLMAKYNLTDIQSTAILEMKLSTLAGLERKKIEDELKEKIDLIKRLKEILASKEKILEIIKKELIQIKSKYYQKRRTRIMPGGVKEFKAEDLVPNEQVIVTVTKDNYIKRVPVSTYRSQKRGGKGKTGLTTKETDIVSQLLIAMTHNKILFFTDRGRVFSSMVYDIPSASRQAKGQALVNFLQLAPDEKVTACLCTDGNVKDNKFFFMTTRFGVIKKTLISKFGDVRKSGLIAIKLRSNDKLEWVFPTSGKDEISIVTRNGQSIRFNETDARQMGRAASGIRGIKLKAEDVVISTNVIASENAQIFTISENGYGKRTGIKEFTMQKRGGVGLRAAKTSNKTGKIIAAEVVYELDDDIMIVSKKGIILRTGLRSVKRLGRDTQGVRLMRVNVDDRVASMTVFSKKSEQIEDEVNKKDQSKNNNKDFNESKIHLNKKLQKTKLKPNLQTQQINEQKPFKVKKDIKDELSELNKSKKINKPSESKISTDNKPNYWGKNK